MLTTPCGVEKGKRDIPFLQGEGISASTRSPKKSRELRGSGRVARRPRKRRKNFGAADGRLLKKERVSYGGKAIAGRLRRGGRGIIQSASRRKTAITAKEGADSP